MTNLSLKSINKYHQAALSERYNALHDALTGLKNRQFMLNSMKAKIQADQSFALMLIDLDNFKHINDAFGHLAGDALLKAIATRMQAHTVNGTDLIRLGGDEFAVILPYQQYREINSCIKQLQSSIKKEFLVRGTVVHVQMSIGIACYPTQSSSITELIKCADLAMYEAKERRSSFCYYSSSYQQSTKQHLQLIDQIRNALDNDEFSLHYQPIFSLGSRAVYSVEALLRWQQADGSFISPSLFIPAAEKAGLISAITRQVINKALGQLASWQERELYTRLQINLSAHDLQGNEIIDYLSDQLELFNIDPQLIIIEITESAMMTDIQSAKTAIKALHKLGVTLCVDDFGAGFTSFTMLSDLPIRQIKIDRQYVLEMDSENNNFEIISSIAFLANRIKAHIVIEGIENEFQLNKLKSLDNVLAQGHYLSEPLCVETLENYLLKVEHQLAR
ncbi:bifunctional diguanylate cyclase/phosphodiesterase [Photobacterium sp. SDRW27]|uniref:putative bifunctional diguanylate cyclase/phosphodiesterase n=1 Tax=Photobacterium obscurum TaxID=2829490 RepID=UPI002243E172|nr:bifunctional diguanylate cyclase/phosphodiesterase [Photobacterium obscurum]MCW8328558.1 bifunctional diguanylate cyclase/phosphodiesterase [Photobacterium obscurum]